MATCIKGTQNSFLQNYLRGTGRTLTVAQAAKKFNIRNLRARLSELRELGLQVRSTRTKAGYAKYTIDARDARGSRKSLALGK